MSSVMIKHPVRFDKTLREYLPELLGRDIRIGFDHGSAFVYIGPVTNDTEAELLRIQSEIRAQIVRSGKDAAAEHAKLMVMGCDAWVQAERDKAKKRYDACRTHMRPWKEPDLDELARKYTEKLGYLERTIDRGHRYDTTPQFMMNAKVTEQYPSIDPECRGVTILLLDGDVRGGYWTENEYKKGKPQFCMDDEEEEPDEHD